MKKRKLIVLFLSICILMILIMGLASCYRNGNIEIEDCIVKYDGKSHAVVATNDTNGDFTYRYVSKELGYDSEQAPVEVGNYVVTVSKKGYKTATCNLEISTDFWFDGNSSVIGIIMNNESVQHIPSTINGKEVKEIYGLELKKDVKELHLPSTIEKITSLSIEGEILVYMSSTPKINYLEVDIDKMLFNIDGVKEEIAPEYFSENQIKRIDILGENFSSIKVINSIANTYIDTVYLREDSKVEKSLPSNVKTVIVKYGYEIQNNFLTMQGLIENLILTTDEERILVKSDSFINLTEVMNFIPSKNIYFSDWTRELHTSEFDPTPEKYVCDPRNLPKIDMLIIEDDVEEIGVCQYARLYCNEMIIPNVLREVQLWGLATGASKFSLPESLEYIGDRAFIGSDITELKIPKTMKYIGYEAFANCFELDGEVILPENLEYLGGGAFYRCEKLKRVIDNSQITVIRERAFSYCLELREYVFNDSLERIGKRAFCGDGFLQYIYLPDSLKYIETKAFSSAGSRKIVIPEGIVEIEGMAFMNLPSLKSNSSKYVVEDNIFGYGYLIRTEDKFLMNFDETRDIMDKYIPEININGLCDEIYDWLNEKWRHEKCRLIINSSIKEYKYNKLIMEKGHIVIPKHVTEQPIFNVEVGGGFIYESAVPPKMPDTESLRMDGKEIIVPKGSIDAYKQAFSKYANADELIAKLVEAQ